MGNNEKILQPEDKSESQLQGERTLSDAEAIRGGAGYERGVELHFTEEQIREARREMRYEQDPRYHAYIDWESFRKKLNDLIVLMSRDSSYFDLNFSKKFLELKKEMSDFETQYGFGFGPGYGGVSHEFSNIVEMLGDKDKKMQYEKEEEIKKALKKIDKDMILIATGMDVVQRIS